MSRELKRKTQKIIVDESYALRTRVNDAEEALRAIRGGEVDALIVSGVAGEQVYTLNGADRFYRVLIEDMNEGALTLTAGGLILYANRRFGEMLKTPLEKVIGSKIRTWIAPDSQPMLQSLMEKGEDEKRCVQIELTTGEGKLVPVNLSVSNLPSDEMPYSFCLVATDLTEQKRGDAIAASDKLARGLLEASTHSRLALLSVIEDQKRAEEALRESEVKYRSIFESVQDVYYETTMDSMILEVSPSIEVISNGQYLRDDLIGKPIFGLYASAVEWQGLLALLQERGSITDYEIAFKNRDGSVVPCSVSSKIRFDAQGREEKISGSMRDITVRRRAEEELIQERNLLKALMVNTSDHIYFKDTDSRFVKINKAQAEAFGLNDPSEAVGKTDFDFFTEEHARYACENEREIMKTGFPILGIEERETWPDGHVTWVSTTKVPRTDIKGEIIGTIGISRDITDRKRGEDELQHQLKELQRWHAVTIDREERVIELKKEVNDLLKEAGRQARYAGNND
jgi:PAS domain S-box-containing protein